MKIYNTLSGKKEEFVSLYPDEVKMYFCGMTLQESPHIGHMRAAITADVLSRYLLYKGYKIIYIQNFTDIDDKVIEKAKEENKDYREIADFYETEYIKASEKMNILSPTFMPRATQHIQEIIEIVQGLIEKGFAYEIDGDVYFSVKKFSGYGKLSGKDINKLISGARVAIDTKKKDPLDFALWKKSKRGEPYWFSPWGKGRPGWHIECSAMSMHYLGETFDIHGGGSDLIFPHHENEIAQSESFTGKPFAKFWVHNAMVNIKGEKMSKSLLNFIPILSLLDEYSPNDLRIYLLKTHYRSPIDYSRETLNQAKNAMERINIFLEKPSLCPNEDSFSTESYMQKFVNAMEDDLNTPKAISVIFDLVRDGNNAIEKGETERIYYIQSVIKDLMNILGFQLKIEGKKSDITGNLIEYLLKIRKELREKNEWDKADEIRDFLSQKGIIVEDTSDKTIWRKKY